MRKYDVLPPLVCHLALCSLKNQFSIVKGTKFSHRFKSFLPETKPIREQPNSNMARIPAGILLVVVDNTYKKDGAMEVTDV